ncbi:leucine-rich repeat-containing protein 69 isoform X1 [Fundulus heteroclitus]|uniref:leucine-rich repeat-containing protein 69 isoform X1 n=1 Tax=Fundulus heteroclitus TaxID=8078 RepID=UPI00165B934D|nr:leucine-rich repeat-containing protein 69 isoform X1 [Fundulus heteroclitus]
MAYGSFTLRGAVVREFYDKRTSLNLNSRKLSRVPEFVTRFSNLSVLLLCNNSITVLPPQLQSLKHLTELNLGNNALKEVPVVLSGLESLRKLYLYSNNIDAVPPDVIGRLGNLVVLNLNHNNIRRLPPEIGSLMKLQRLGLLDNKLEELPDEVGRLTELSELNLTFNQLSRLPRELYRCRELKRLHVARNKLTSLPEGITALAKLQVLDVAGNMLSMFPVEFHRLPLRELYCEENGLVQCELVPLLENTELLSLKELAARFVLQEDRKKSSLIHLKLPHYPDLSDLLASRGRCAVCQSPFLTTWLECVHFISLEKDMNMRSCLTVPVRARLCSYSCFRSGGRSYYGVETS